jgi:phenylalanyl-tRNA synthetase beta subunit
MDVMNYFNIMTGNTSYIVETSDIKLEENKLNNVDILTDVTEIKDGYLVVVASSFKTNPMSIKNLDMNFGLKNARGTTNRFIEDTANLIVEYGQKFGYIKEASELVIETISDSKEIKYSKERLFSLIGEEIDLEPIFKKLSLLGIEFGDSEVKIPSYRKDIDGEQDLVEEILRIYGIDNVKHRADSKQDKLENEFHKSQTERIGDFLINNGFYESKTYQLLTEKDSKSYDI